MNQEESILSSNLKPLLGTQINPYHPLSRGLIGCWNFNERAGGVVFDLSNDKRHGAVAGSPERVADGLDFELTSEYVDCGQLNMGGWTEFTASMSYRVRSFPGLDYPQNLIMCNRTWNSAFFYIMHNDDGGGLDYLPWVGGRSADSSYTLEGFEVRGGYQVAGLAGWDEAGVDPNGGFVHPGSSYIVGVDAGHGGGNITATLRNSVVHGFSTANYDFKQPDPNMAKAGNTYPWDYHAGVNGGNQSDNVVENSLLYDNETGVSGGHSPGNVIVRNSTIADNFIAVTSVHGDDPGMEKVLVENSILWDNTWDNCNDLGPGTHRFNYSIYDPAKTLFGSPGGFGGVVILAGANNLNVDPLFVGGGGAAGYQLSAGSPAKDAGSNGLIPGWLVASDLDLYGNDRTASPVDMGAHEVPEPATMIILGIGTVGALLRRRRRRA